MAKLRAGESFDYGQYAELNKDKRTWQALRSVESLAKRHKIQYAVVGGFAAYLQSKNPLEDYPDIDILLYADYTAADEFLRLLSLLPKFKVFFVDNTEVGVFGSFLYDGDIQFDFFTSLDAAQPEKSDRIRGIAVEPVESLIADIRMALDLLAYTDYDRRWLYVLADDYHISRKTHPGQRRGTVGTAMHFARRLAAGKLSPEGLNNVVKRLMR